MLTERLLMNDQVAKQRILGTIHAAPNGVTLTTLTWLAAEQGALRTARIRELARGYARQHLIRIDDDVCYPTAKLTREVATFMGVGSEVYGAVRNSRYGVGVELKASYYRQALKNLASADDELEQFEMVVDEVAVAE